MNTPDGQDGTPAGGPHDAHTAPKPVPAASQPGRTTQRKSATPKRRRTPAELREFETRCYNGFNQYLTYDQIGELFVPPETAVAVSKAVKRVLKRLHICSIDEPERLREQLVARSLSRARAVSGILYQMQEEKKVVDGKTVTVFSPAHPPDLRLRAMKELRTEDTLILDAFTRASDRPQPVKTGSGVQEAPAEKTEAQTLFELLGLFDGDPALRKRVKAAYNARRGVDDEDDADEWKPDNFAKPEERPEMPAPAVVEPSADGILHDDDPVFGDDAADDDDDDADAAAAGDATPDAAKPAAMPAPLRRIPRPPAPRASYPGDGPDARRDRGGD